MLLVIGDFGQTYDSLDFVYDKAVEQWGAVQLLSPLFEFDQTTYYSKTMGSDLKKQFWGLKTLIDKGELPKIKHLTNEWEAEYADKYKSEHVARPVNIDPGYLTEAKLVLATTKDRDHRLYLAEGILRWTLYYQRRQWKSSLDSRII